MSVCVCTHHQQLTLQTESNKCSENILMQQKRNHTRNSKGNYVPERDYKRIVHTNDCHGKAYHGCCIASSSTANAEEKGECAAWIAMIFHLHTDAAKESAVKCSIIKK